MIRERGLNSMKKLLKILMLFIFAVGATIVLCGCGMQDVAGDYRTDNDEWITLDYYGNAIRIRDTTGTLCINNEEMEIHCWNYKNGQLNIRTESNTGNPLDFGDYYGTYYEGTIQLYYEGQEYLFSRAAAEEYVVQQIAEELKDRFGDSNGIADEERDTEETLGVDKQTAQSDGGWYILLEGDEFWPLQRAEKTNQYDQDDNFVMTSIYTEDIPVLYDAEKLVLFSENTIGEVVIFPVLDSGYTVPLSFRSYPNHYYEEKTVSSFDFTGTRIVDEALDTQVRGLYSAGFPEDGICTIEVEDYGYEAFYNDRVMDTNTYCSGDRDAFGDGCYSWGVMFPDMEKEENVTISFYEGTQYIEYTLTADLHYFVYDGCEKRDGYSGEYPEIVLTTEGFAEIDVSGLSNGYYILQYHGLGFMNYYIFEVNR